MIALSYFLSSQGKSIISLDLYHDTEMRESYILENKRFEGKEKIVVEKR
jgi:hypothetical protein